MTNTRSARTWIGYDKIYDLESHMQFSLLTLLGLREHHTLLDIGCGSLRAGRLFIIYLGPGKYCGVEPEEWLVNEGIERELAKEIIDRKQPRFHFSSDFDLSHFEKRFDYLLAQSVFSHATQQQVITCLREAASVMSEDSLFVASFAEGEENNQNKEWVYPGLVTFRWQWMSQAAEDAGLCCTRLEWFHPGGQTWVIFHKPATALPVRELASINQQQGLKEELQLYRVKAIAYEHLIRHPLIRILRTIKRILSRTLGIVHQRSDKQKGS